MFWLRKMDAEINSDRNKQKMLASKAFDHLLQQVQTSTLNYQIKISPFSAIISLKKSLVKDKAGIPLFPTISDLASSFEHDRTEKLLAINAKLEEEVFNLQNNNKDALKECDISQQAVKALDSELKFKNKTKPATIKAELKELTQI